MVRLTRHNPTSNRRKYSTDSSALAGALRDVELMFKEADARKEERFRRGVRPDAINLIEHGPLRVVLSATPTDDTLPSFINTLHAYNVTHVVRVCEPHYDAAALERRGFRHSDWYFKDGESPPADVVDNWLGLLDDMFELNRHSRCYTSAYTPDSLVEEEVSISGSSLVGSEAGSSPASSTDCQQISSVVKKTTVAIHCAAGLGRAPVLVAIALVELGLSAQEAVGWLRALRRGAISAHQFAYLQQYEPRPLITDEKVSKRSRSPFSFWRKSSRRTKSPTASWINSRGGSPGRGGADDRWADRPVVWADGKRSSQPTPGGGSSPSYHALKAMRKKQVERGRNGSY